MSENGFIILPDPLHEETFADKYYDRSIPDMEKPNCFIAPFWRDLDLNKGGSIKSGIVTRGPVYYLCISWIDVPNAKNDNEQTFQVLLQLSPTLYIQHLIWFQYKDITLDDQTTVGIEDQTGIKGQSYNYQLLGNRKALYIQQGSNTAYIDGLTIKIDAETPNAWTCIDENEYNIRGNNVELREYIPMDDDLFAKALGGPWTLLISAYKFVGGASRIVPAVGIMLGCTSFIVDWAIEMAKIQNKAMAFDLQPGPGPHTYAQARAVSTSPSPATVVDADFNVVALWVLTDPNDQDQTLKVTSELSYFEVTAYGDIVYEGTISTSVTLNLNDDDNDDFATADEVCLKQTYSRLFLGGSDKQDFYTFNIDERRIRRILRASMTPPFDADFDLYLYNPDCEPEGSSTNRENGMQENIYFNATSTGNWYVEATNYSNNDYGFYTLRIDVIPDINGDQLVDIVDIVIVALAFEATPEDPNWNPLADITEPWDLVDITDVVEVAIHFGESYEGGGLESRTGSPKTSPLNGGTAAISICPNTLTAYKGESFSVNVTLTDVSSLYGWELKLYWNNTILNCTGAEIHTPDIWSGKTAEAGPGIQTNVSATQGRYYKGMSALNPAQSFNGSTTVATLTFKAMATGTTVLDLQDTKLVDSKADIITPATEDGSVTVLYGRYMRGDTDTVNNLTAYVLNATKSNIPQNRSRSDSLTFRWPIGYVGAKKVYYGIRVWVRHANGTETELTGGTPVAEVSRNKNGEGIQMATWNCPPTSVGSTDALVVRVYIGFYIVPGGYVEWPSEASAEFITEQLEAEQLVGSTWTIYYYTKCTFAYAGPSTWEVKGYFYWGTNTYNSRIENLQYT